MANGSYEDSVSCIVACAEDILDGPPILYHVIDTVEAALFHI